jgi:ribosomal protein S18 acetylase RimI-like enzyme
MLKHALRADLPAVVDIWVDAFSGDPFFRWIAPEDATYEAFAPAWLGMVADLCFERGHTSWCPQAAIAWIPPDLALVGPEGMERARDLIAAHAGEDRAEQALAVVREARSRVLDEPHWTLQYVGVRPTTQGTGLGAAIANIGLAVADRDDRPCALISTNGRNVAFYERLGFEVTAAVDVPDGSAALRPMLRSPGSQVEHMLGRHIDRSQRPVLGRAATAGT